MRKNSIGRQSRLYSMNDRKSSAVPTNSTGWLLRTKSWVEPLPSSFGPATRISLSDMPRKSFSVSESPLALAKRIQVG